jgi:hypothetical protein
MKIEQAGCSETSAYKIQIPGRKKVFQKKTYNLVRLVTSISAINLEATIYGSNSCYQ